METLIPTCRAYSEQMARPNRLTLPTERRQDTEQHIYNQQTNRYVLTPLAKWFGVLNMSTANDTTSVHIIYMPPPHAGYDNKRPVPRVVHLRPNPKITNEQLITRAITEIPYPMAPIILLLVPLLRHRSLFLRLPMCCREQSKLLMDKIVRVTIPRRCS